MAESNQTNKTLFAETSIVLDEAANLGIDIDSDTWLEFIELAADELDVTLDFAYDSSPKAKAWRTRGEDADEDRQIELFDLVTEAAAALASDAADQAADDLDPGRR